MAAITQKGTTLKVGFTGSTITSLIMEDSTKESSGEQTVVKDENNATGTILVSDLGKTVSFTAVVIGAYAGDLPPALGTTITVGTTKYRVTAASFKQNRTQSTLSVSGIREDSMTAIYDA
jgi:hypothetical protein